MWKINIMAVVLVNVFIVYLIIGFLFSIAFVIRGAYAIDKEVLNSPKTFRLLLIPGAILLWPVLLTKWVKS